MTIVLQLIIQQTGYVCQCFDTGAISHVCAWANLSAYVQVFYPYKNELGKKIKLSDVFDSGHNDFDESVVYKVQK